MNARIDNPRSKLDKLDADEQEAVRAHCEHISLPEGIRWLKAEFDIDITGAGLSAWLRKRRLRKSAAAPIRKTHPSCKLSKLTPEQQDMIFAHCGTAPLEEGAAWIKKEFAIDLAGNNLGRWLHRQRLQRALEPRLAHIRDMSDCATLVRNILGAATELTEANIILVAQIVFEEFSKPVAERDHERLVQYMKLVLQARNQDIRNRSVDLAYERHHLDVATLATRHAAQLQEISAGEGSESEKIKEVIKLLFGERPSNTTFQTEEAAPAGQP
jgi:hypothetical protein